MLRRGCMEDLKRSLVTSLALGTMSVLAFGVGHLALTDMWHGESNLSLEWNVLRLAGLVVILFHVSAFATMWQVFRALRQG